ncbi:hypothetical protein UA42_00130 [Photobacterium kishitanii]|uniref:hypothetical protein n=1 Tax=Photobacterium kishitanii TaxID=318456 RepID=UPI0005D40224|nr:hypothetical protein [Photobacterium kishitanii]KJG62868.1 hypothetical protein UA42_00130 [Photobacterium kishitanii]KJG64207.1 hypothetical protein UA40_17860 [Photobacterium kishitanii]KJG68773.1 hypothetical protein UA41_15145 [Photobacterium kishitanii]
MNEHNYRLLYIWIDNYKNIHRKGIQVTLDYHITKNNDEITVEKTLFAELNDNPLNQLDAFSAIVGKNGAGKSHFLHIIRQVLCNGYFPDDVTKSFAIFEITMNNCDKQLVMLTTQPKQYQFLSGSMISNLPSEKIQVIEYNPFNYDLEYTCDLSTHNNLRRIDSYHSISSLHQTEILKRAEQLSLSKEAMVYKALESVNKNPHAHFVVRYSDLLESVQACSPIRLNSKSRLEKEWMTAFRDYFKSKIQESNYDIEMFILCYCFLFWRELLNQYKKELSQSFKASINEVSLAFMMITLFSGDNNHKLSFYIQTASKYFEKKRFSRC